MRMNDALQASPQIPRRWHLKRPAITFAANAWTSAWQPLLGGPQPIPWAWTVCDGLRPGFVLSFGYWCTNFLVVQRAMAARNMTAARRTPLIAAMPKMLFPALVILPGMIAVALTAMPGKAIAFRRRSSDEAYAKRSRP